MGIWFCVSFFYVFAQRVNKWKLKIKRISVEARGCEGVGHFNISFIIAPTTRRRIWNWKRKRIVFVWIASRRKKNGILWRTLWVNETFTFFHFSSVYPLPSQFTYFVVIRFHISVSAYFRRSREKMFFSIVCREHRNTLLFSASLNTPGHHWMLIERTWNDALNMSCTCDWWPTALTLLCSTIIFSLTSSCRSLS